MDKRQRVEKLTKLVIALENAAELAREIVNEPEYFKNTKETTDIIDGLLSDYKNSVETHNSHTDEEFLAKNFGMPDEFFDNYVMPKAIYSFMIDTLQYGYLVKKKADGGLFVEGLNIHIDLDDADIHLGDDHDDDDDE